MKIYRHRIKKLALFESSLHRTPAKCTDCLSSNSTLHGSSTSEPSESTSFTSTTLSKSFHTALPGLPVQSQANTIMSCQWRRDNLNIQGYSGLSEPFRAGPAYQARQDHPGQPSGNRGNLNEVNEVMDHVN